MGGCFASIYTGTAAQIAAALEELKLAGLHVTREAGRGQDFVAVIGLDGHPQGEIVLVCTMADSGRNSVMLLWKTPFLRGLFSRLKSIPADEIAQQADDALSRAGCDFQNGRRPHRH